MSKLVSESMKHHCTEINELNNLPEVTIKSFIHFWDVFLCGVSPAKEKIGINYYLYELIIMAYIFIITVTYLLKNFQEKFANNLSVTMIETNITI